MTTRVLSAPGPAAFTLNAVTSPMMRARLAERFQRDPAYRVLHYLLGPDRVLEWVHSVGVTTDASLAECVAPIPPIELRQITSEPDPELFLYTGFVDLTTLLNLYAHHTPERPPRPRVLDFGCGCGRMARFLDPSQWEIVASDVNPDHVAWCGAHLSGVETLRNGPAPPTGFDDGSFDLIYSLSIFSHLSGRMVTAWLAELARLVRPGGRIILTYHGEHALRVIADSVQHQVMLRMDAAQVSAVLDQLQHEGLIMLPYDAPTLALANVATADYGTTFMGSRFAVESCRQHGLTTLAHVPAGMRGFQDILVLGLEEPVRGDDLL